MGRQGGASHHVLTFAPHFQQVRPLADVHLWTGFSIPKVFFDETIRNSQNDVGNVFSLIKIQALRLYFPCTSLVYSLCTNV